ncbi:MULTISPECIES: hypothetical protein [Xanthomonas]|uniref:hypothetical protein n=1 Tax=Xanthomonas TaxID=338 RepID=UPI001C4470B1|nr:MULTISPECIES: hypothetical protein [Xanthomonas]MBV6855892.1 hypothetical protein [Xanthomonas campestris pv. mirabilis]MBV6867873.1 hypothetical protein [Xanthomonas campestris pv. coriandri]MCE4330793.1 hypothetical protein [Xanthomonas campestris pv. coriandri]MEA9776940.1 hypothetical protein [Xanthomonas campestris pv. raphani]
MHQTSMTGDDWLSDNDRKRKARAIELRKKAGQNCAKKLQAAAEALSDYARACGECKDGSGPRSLDDSRLILSRDINEYASWLEGRYDR